MEILLETHQLFTRRAMPVEQDIIFSAALEYSRRDEIHQLSFQDRSYCG